MNKKRVAAIIQARMASTRLPGKVLLPLAGKPLLDHIIDRLRRCRTLDIIAIATSEQPCDDALVIFAQQRGVELVRGSEDNVLQRYSKAAAELDADYIVRVTGDAPLIDPEILDRMVETLLQKEAEYCTTETGIHSIHEGFCTFTRAALDRLMTEAYDDPVAIEHVTAFFVAHPERFHIARIPISVEHRFQGARISIDTPADVQFIEELYRQLAVPAGEANMVDVVQLLKSKPELVKINAHVYQKKATDRSRKVLIRCDGDSRTGLGHVVRCLALADTLREKHGCGVVFAMASGEPGVKLVREAGFPLEHRKEENEDNWLNGLILNHRPDILVLDVRNDLSVEMIGIWRKNGIMIVSIDDPSPRCREADLVFFPPVPQVLDLDWSGFAGELYCGWEWVLLRPQFSLPCTPRQNNPPVILITMGGSDPENFTEKALSALDGLTEAFDTVVVLGPGFTNDVHLHEFLSRSRRTYRLEHDVQDMAALMRRADLAVASFGVTAYELAATGVPAVYLCLSDDHARSASTFINAHLAWGCCVLDECCEEWIAKVVKELLAQPDLRYEMGTRACATVDGEGAVRMAKKIMEAMEARESCNV